MKISAKAVKESYKVVHGAVNSEITLELPGGQQIVSIITKTSAERLGLKEGMDAYAVIKASEVMVATD